MGFVKGDPRINRKGRTPGSASYRTKTQEAFTKIYDSKIKQGNKLVPFPQAWLETFLNDSLNPKSPAYAIMAKLMLPEDTLENIDAKLNKAKREDEDFIQFRLYKDSHKYQQQIILSHDKLILLMAGRRSGKTEGDVRKAMALAVKPDKLVMFVALTVTKCLDLFWTPCLDLIDLLSLEVEEQSRTEGRIKLANGSEIHFKGNSDRAEREKMRGSKWDLVIIDEAQSQNGLMNLIEEIIEPTLVDRDGQLILSGTPPKVRGTHWETMWSDTEKYKGLRLNWNISENPFIKNYQSVLDEIKEKKGLTDASPLFIREYLGRISYDEDAMIYRFTDNNFYTDDQLKTWIMNQPIADVKLVAGLDYGFADSDAFSIICYSINKPEKFVLYEYKANRTGITELVQGINRGIEVVNNLPAFNPNLPGIGGLDKFFYIFCDTNEQKISVELRNQYGLMTNNAYKYDKKLAIEMLQEEVKLGNLKVRDKNSHFYQESLKTIWKRDDDDNLTREIDKSYHPDMMDSIIYALRDGWRYKKNI